MSAAARSSTAGAAAAVATLVLAFSGRPELLAGGFVFVTLWCLVTARDVLRRIVKPKFWIASVAIAALAGLLLGKSANSVAGVPFSIEGLRVGLLMNVRAFTLLASGALIFRFVQREKFIAWTEKIGLKHLDPALAAAMDTLPQVKTTWNRLQAQGAASLFDRAARLLLAFADIAENSPRSAPGADDVRRSTSAIE